MTISPIFNLNRKIASICAVLLGFSIPISTSLDSILLALFLLTALIGWNTQYPRIISQNSVAKAALLLFLILFIGCFYGTEKLNAGIKILTKYDDLILIALMLPIFVQPKMRLYGQYAFMAAMTLTLVLSYLIWLGAFEGTRFFVSRMPDNPVVFKLHITHGIFMAFSSYLFAIKASINQGKWRFVYSVLALLAVFNVLFMVQGRTGYLVLAGLAIFFATNIFGRSGIALAAIGILVIALTGYFLSDRFHDRVELANKEYQQWQPENGNKEVSSIGTRMDFYTNTTKIIIKNPIFGVGTGGFEQAYQKEIVGTTYAPSVNPHNQFLLFGAQIGAIGLSAFLLLLATEWKLSCRLSNEDYLLARGLVITIAVGCLFNSLLLDHSEGLFFGWVSALVFAGMQNKATNADVLNVNY